MILNEEECVILNGFAPQPEILQQSLQRSKERKNNKTLSEIHFAKLLFQNGFNFKVEVPIFISNERYYIADFLLNNKFIIEIDGISHENKEQYDKQRNDILKTFGISTARFKTEIVGNKQKFIMYKHNINDDETIISHRLFSEVGFAEIKMKNKNKKKKGKKDQKSFDRHEKMVKRKWEKILRRERERVSTDEEVQKRIQKKHDLWGNLLPEDPGSIAAKRLLKEREEQKKLLN